MSYKVEKLPGEQIVILTISADYNSEIETKEAVLARVTNMFDEQDRPFYFIIDLREAKLALDEVIGGSSMVTRQMHLFQHPKIRSIIMVSSSRMVTLAARGLENPIFGSIHIEVISSMEDALAFARRK